MATVIKSPAQIKSVNNKRIEEYFGYVATKQKNISIALMTTQEGWEEEPQVAKFDEYVYVISGTLFVRTKNDDYVIRAKEAIEIKKGEWVQYSTPFTPGATYMAICLPAFQSSLVKPSDKKKNDKI